VTGRVILVGAGPGDPELLTLKAVRAIAAADVVLVDDLVDRRALDHARRSARIVPVGKRGGCRSTPQAFIERLMITEAGAGRCVVRLKGGDPFLFGRGGEEAEHLRAAGVEVEVIPGITSGLAAAAAAGFSVTHREASPGVVFVTGHEKDDRHGRVDWPLLARSGLTLVVYMGVANAARIADALLAGGLDPETPVAAIQDATLAQQKVARGVLRDLGEWLPRARIASPAILVIGAVAARTDTAVAHAIAA
jgi:uroporphyrin-III C-methyltransferase